MTNWQKIKQTIGPSLLYAGAAIGVSHLVNSTKAGALFGYQLVWVIIVANLIKFPFFEFATRYAISTKNNLITGYKSLHISAFIILLLLTLSTMLIIQSGVTIVTAGILEKILNIDSMNLSFWHFSLLVLIACAAILMIGKYSSLDKTMKFIIFILSFCTIFSVCMSFQVDIPKENALKTVFRFSQKEHLIFLMILAGWMPAPMDITIWSSIWTSEKQKNLQANTSKSSLKNFLIDFHLGYWLTAILAIFFLALGAQVIFGTGEELSNKGSIFTEQLIKIYTKSIGNWSYWIIISTAFATMFSTTLTCLDAYGRVMREYTKNIFPQFQNEKKIYNIWILIIMIASVIILANFIKNMGQMIQIATIISFLTAPIIAIINYLLIKSKHTPQEVRPSKLFSIYSIVCIIVLCLFSLIFLLFL